MYSVIHSLIFITDRFYLKLIVFFQTALNPETAFYNDSCGRENLNLNLGETTSHISRVFQRTIKRLFFLTGLSATAESGPST